MNENPCFFFRSIIKQMQGREIDALYKAIHIWFEHSRIALNVGQPPPRAIREGLLLRKVEELGVFFSALAKQAPKLFDCAHLHDGIASTSDLLTSGGAGGDNQDSSAAGQIFECQEQARVASFLRATTQCIEFGLVLCIQQQQQLGREGLLSHQLCTAVWGIMAAMEPRLFLDPRPFWTGVGEPSVARPLWQLYCRLFLLTGFEIQHRFRQKRRAELNRQSRAPLQTGTDVQSEGIGEEEEEEPFDPEKDRRPFRTPSDVGLGDGPDDEYDPADAESWTMSMLFGCLDVMADEWNRAMYTTPTLALIARCLLRYAMIGYTRTSPAMVSLAQEQGTNPVHDMAEYTVRGIHQARGWIGVNHETYYDQGGATLRDMLKDLCIVALSDVWLQHLNQAAEPSQYDHWQRRCLARRLHEVVKRELESEPDRGGGAAFSEPLFICCSEAGLLPPRQDTARLEDSEWMRLVTSRCFDAMAEFLDSGAGAEAEKAIGRSGVVHIVLPGEIWRFVHQWPNMGVTPVNVVNGLRSRDMTLYQDHLLSKRLSALARARGRQLPTCLSPLVDHLVWESFRHMLRLVTVRQGTEAFPHFLVEPHQWQSILLEFSSFETATGHAVWKRFFRWTRLVQHVRSQHDELEPAGCWCQIMDTAARVLVDRGPSQLRGGVAEYPPFPQILLFGGRTLLWNPLAKPVPSPQHGEIPFDDEYDDDDDDDDEDESLLWEWIPRVEDIRVWLGQPLIDVSSNAAPMTAILWLCGRIGVIVSILRRLDAGNQDHRAACLMGEGKLEMYHRLLTQLLRDPEEAGEDEREDIVFWEPMQIVSKDQTDMEM